MTSPSLSPGLGVTPAARVSDWPTCRPSRAEDPGPDADPSRHPPVPSCTGGRVRKPDRAGGNLRFLHGSRVKQGEGRGLRPF